MGDTPALKIEGLNHRYGKHIALDNVHLTLPTGRVCGLLGRNGAGKTTLLNIVSTAMRAHSGSVQVFGSRPMESPRTLSKLCYVRENGMFPPGARLRDVLYGCSMLYPNWDREYAKRMVDMFELNTAKKYKQLSRGMESSLGLVIGLASRAELTLFDEPSLGLDAAAREHFYDEMARDVRTHPRTMVISTHLIDEVSRLFEDVVIIDRGRVIRQQPLKELVRGHIMLTGSRPDVEAVARGHRVIRIEQLEDGNTRFIAEWDGGPVPEGVLAEPVPLQRLFVCLTEGDEA